MHTHTHDKNEHVRAKVCSPSAFFRFLLSRQHVLDVYCVCHNALSENNGLRCAEELEWTKLLKDVMRFASLQELTHTHARARTLVCVCVCVCVCV